MLAICDYTPTNKQTCGTSQRLLRGPDVVLHVCSWENAGVEESRVGTMNDVQGAYKTE